MSEVLLDTHVWIWLSIEAFDEISPKASRTIKKARRKWISAISIWELCKLTEKGRIAFSIPLLEWITRSLSGNEIFVSHLEPEVCVESCSLKGFHQDPADQIIVATARLLQVPLITSDRRIRAYSGIKVIW